MPDTTPPSLRGIRFNPYTAEPSANLVLDFDEAVQLDPNGKITLRRADTGALVETVQVGAGLSASGSSVTINPTHDLAYATDYYLTVESGTITDTAGNSLSLPADQSSQTFTTTDNSDAPKLTGIGFSASSAGQAERNADIVLNFSEAVTLRNGATMTLRRASDDVAVETLGVGTGLSVSGSSITVNPNHDLDYATGYYLDVDPQSVRDDAASNIGTGQSLTLGSGNFAFRTVADPAAPILRGMAPVSFSQVTYSGDATPNADIVLNFQQGVQLSNTGSVTLRRADTKAVVEILPAMGGRLSTSGSSVTINPTNDLDYATKYYLTVESGAIADGTNHPYKVSDNTTLAFTTGADDVAPSLLGVAFSAAGQDGRPTPGADLVLTFSERVRLADSQSPNAGSITLRRADTQAIVETLTVAGGGLSAGGSSVTINPTQDLDYATQYYVSFDGDVVEDAAGNAATGRSSSFQTTAAPTTPSPTPTDPNPPLVDGVAVTTGTQTLPDGSSVPVTTIPVVTADRTNSDTTSPAADIPLVTGAGGARQLTVQVPTGYGLQAIGPSTSGFDGLIAAIKSRTMAGSADQTALTGGGSGFLATLGSNTNLTVRTIVPSVAPGVTTAPAQALIIQGQPLAQDAGQQQALVIDTTQLPAGSTLQLENVDFAAIIGAATVRAPATSAVGGSTGSLNAVGALTLTPDPLRVYGDGAAQTFIGGVSDDLLSGGAGLDTLLGGQGGDLIYGNQGADLIYGNQGADTLFGGQGDDRAFGGQGDDRVLGNAGNDVLFGNAGNDVVYGNQGSDIVYGNQGQDTLFGGQDADTLFGGQDADIVYGNLGADIVYGNQGADILYGGQGNDTLYGGQGDDTLVGGIGDDILVGGLGADRYVFGANSGRDLILGFNQADGDRISLGGQTYTVSSAQNGDALLTLSGGGAIQLAAITASQFGGGYLA